MNLQADLINNDVPATGQLAENDSVKFCVRNAANIKILFLGNSITRHGVNKELGWYGDHGMAASCAENDYVHRLISMIERDGKIPSYCVCNMSEWESSWNDELLEKNYGAARDFGAGAFEVVAHEDFAARKDDE
ncbi:MAG: hypothetical protein K2L54_01305, partial [Clostridiales bacterium]|nr:hypothetical protein [Clostridiales bacterium]